MRTKRAALLRQWLRVRRAMPGGQSTTVMRKTAPSPKKDDKDGGARGRGGSNTGSKVNRIHVFFISYFQTIQNSNHIL